MDSRNSCLFCRPIILMAGIWAMLCLPGPIMASDGYIGAETCLRCHDTMVDRFTHTLHGRVFCQNTPYYENRCECCHGPGKAHKENPSSEAIVTFGKRALSTVKERNGRCLDCHETGREIAMWQGGRHAKQDLACDSCHSAHKGYDPVDRSPEACYKCHLNIKIDAQKQSRHPIREGKVRCGNCHNPHGSLSDHMLSADHANDLCFKCHAEKRGPFMFEHAPVEENCGTCHTPHGSRHKKLLIQRAPSLCQNCHMDVHTSTRAWDQTAGFKGTRPSSHYYGRSCITCHPNVHGSQAPTTSGRLFMN